MPAPRPSSRPLPALALAGYSLLVLLYAAQMSVYRASRDEPAAWGQEVLAGLAEWYSWALLTPLIAWLFLRLSAMRRPWPLQVLAHVPAAFGFAVAHLTLLAAARQLFHLDAREWTIAWERFVLTLSKRTDSDMLTYGLLVGVGLALRSHEQYRMKALQLAQAQLQLLRSQLQPHFLFNTLHAISTLMHKDVEAADQMMSRLSDLLRVSLDSAERHEVTLAEELDILAPYLGIEQTRFSDRLRVQLDIQPEARRALVPALLLQPLVENAIRHGIAPRRGPGEVRVTAELRGDRLHVEVSDDGVGPPPSLQEGVGLRNTRERLKQLYGDAGAVTVGARAPGGFSAQLSLPFRRSAA